MDMHSATTQGSPSPAITVQDTIVKATEILDMAGDELMIAQQAVEECVRDFPLTDAEMRRLQKLDVATQTVASVARVLRNLMSLSPTGVSDSVSLTHVYDGVTLGEVVQVLKGEHAPDVSVAAGEIDLF
ncbi:hypothetical protein [Gluconacetobacter takamatsuzukensis]|uniref:Uncharacterized protein n=1 Tax=Gluconacetobacter takamatsuzukensis TaxID=1286190 RepID=A0A7W4PMI0_9PROT|nr:hypothetical protein [Gluconacetobacter takamatsuzukensis]MBB2203602.1 hypothetical protein [Gluconacetobacter takamatsuzukensis]